MNIFKHFSLTARFLLWFLGVALISIITVAYLSYNSAQQSLVNQEIKALQSFGESTEQSISTYFQDRGRIMESIAVNSNIQKMEDKVLITGELNEAFNNLKQSGASEIFLMDMNGKVIASTDPKNVGLDKKTDDYFTGAIEAKDAHVKDLYKSSTTGRVEFVVSVPVFAHDNNGNLNGVLAQRVGAASNTGQEVGVVAERMQLLHYMTN